MLNLKKKNLNIVLGVILIGLMYHTPSFLHNVATNVLGRATLLIILSYLSLRCDFSCAIIFALIIIVLFQNTVEGLGGMSQTTVTTTEEEVEEQEAQDIQNEGEAAVAAFEASQQNNSNSSNTGSTKEPNENMSDDATGAATEATQDGLDAATGGTEDALGISFTRPINSFTDFFVSTYKNAVGLTRQTAGIVKKEEMQNKETFLGMNFVNDLNGIIKKAKNNLTNMTDLDRRLKTSAETNTIYSSRDVM